MVWAQTTGVTRTKMTMQTVLAGLFPPQGTAMEWNKNLNWQPIPIFSEPLDEDTVRPPQITICLDIFSNRFVCLFEIEYSCSLFVHLALVIPKQLKRCWNSPK